jgi:hypothetical protein
MVHPILESGQESVGERLVPAVNILSNFVHMDRFQSFLDSCQGDASRAENLYIWNIQVSAAFWGGFHLLEIAIRNQIHEKFKSIAGIDDWWDSPNVAILPQERNYVDEAIAKADRNHRNRMPGHVVAELNFGFWVALTTKKYHQSLWVNNLETLFPNFIGRRSELHDDLESLRKLRNRIAHHEPIHKRNLLIDFGNLCAVLGYIDKDISSMVSSLSRVIEVVNAKEQVISGNALRSF